MTHSDADYKVYLEERKLLIQGEQDQSRSLDRDIVLVSSGAIVASLAYPNGFSQPILVWASISFGLAVCLVVISKHFGVVSSVRYREVMDAQISTGDEHLWSRVRDEQNKVGYTSFVLGINWGALCWFVLGVLVFLASMVEAK